MNPASPPDVFFNLKLWLVFFVVAVFFLFDRGKQPTSGFGQHGVLQTFFEMGL